MPPSLWWIKYVIFSHSSLLEAELKLLAYKYFEQSELALTLKPGHFSFLWFCASWAAISLFREHMESPHEESRLWNSREGERNSAISVDASLPDIHHLSDNQTSFSCWDVQWLEYRLIPHATIMHWAINHTIKNDAFLLKMMTFVQPLSVEVVC